jgi:hypothetical protein
MKSISARAITSVDDRFAPAPAWSPPLANSPSHSNEEPAPPTIPSECSSLYGQSYGKSSQTLGRESKRVWNPEHSRDGWPPPAGPSQSSSDPGEAKEVKETEKERVSEVNGH